MKTEEGKINETMEQDLSFISSPTISESEEIPTRQTTPLAHQYKQYRQELETKNNKKKKSTLQADTLTKINLLDKKPLTEKQGSVLIQQQIYEWHLRRKEKTEQEQKKFDFAEEILGVNEMPIGSCLQYISKIEEFSAFNQVHEENVENNIITIPLRNGAYLSSEKPESTVLDDDLPPFGVITPSGEIFYYHCDEKEKDILQKFRPSERYYKYNITSEPFEVYTYKKTQQPHYFNLNNINLLTNREGEKYIRKRMEISTADLKDNEEEFTRLAGIFDPNNMTKSEIKFFKKELQELTLAHEKLALKRDEAFAALERTAAICADIFEPYCEQTVLIPRNLMRKKDLALYVDQILPYKGESLDHLLSSNNKKPLSEEQKLDIAKQCITLICRLYDGSLSKQHRHYSHKRLDLSQFCVLFEENDAGNVVPKVSLIGYKELPENEKTVKSYSGYQAPELTFYEGRKVKPSTPYRVDVYALGVVLNGFKNPIVAPKTKPHERLKSLHPLALLGDVKIGVLTGINTSQLNELQKNEYNMILSLAERMKNASPEKRPDLNELKMASGLTTPFFPALEVIKQEIANETNSDDMDKLEKIAEEIVSIIRAMKAYEEHHRQKKSSSYLNRIEGYLSLLGLHRKNMYETHSNAILNATEFSILSQRLNEFNKFIEDSLKNESKHRPSFVPIFLNALNEKKNSKTDGVQEFKKLVDKIAGKSSDTETEDSRESSLSSFSKKKSSTKRSNWSTSTKSSRVVPFN